MTRWHEGRHEGREWSWWVGVGMIFLGVVLRVVRWGEGRSLWLDEILLAKNLVGRGFGGLLRPLDYRQGAPVGFLWVEKVGMCLWGSSERGMRVVPLVMGCLALWVMWGVGRKLIGGWGGAVVAGILAVLEPAIYYSSEVKQYSGDLLVTLVILRVFIWYSESEARNPKRSGRAWVLGGVGVVGMLFSHPAVFVLGGLWVVMVFGGWVKAEDTGRRAASGTDRDGGGAEKTRARRPRHIGWGGWIGGLWGWVVFGEWCLG